VVEIDWNILESSSPFDCGENLRNLETKSDKRVQQGKARHWPGVPGAAATMHIREKGNASERYEAESERRKQTRVAGVARDFKLMRNVGGTKSINEWIMATE